MLKLQNASLALEVAPDGSAVCLIDMARGVRWCLDNSTYTYRPQDSLDSAQQLVPTSATADGDRIVISCKTPQGEVRYGWTLHDDHAEVGLECSRNDIAMVSLPGAMLSEQGPCQMAIPLYQGALIRGGPSDWRRTARHGGHLNFSMSMGAMLAEGGGLLITHDSHSNWMASYGVSGGQPYFYFEQRRCPVSLWQGGTVRMYPTPRDITAICKMYRRQVQQRGEFVSWEQKLAAKPALKNLFGAVTAFIGYNKTAEIDYVESARQLKGYGFDSIFYFPVRMCSYSIDFKMGGDDPIYLSDREIQAIREIDGSFVSPWGWVIEALDDQTEGIERIFRHSEGHRVAGWQIDQQKWYLVCTPYQIEHIRKRLGGDMKAMDWIHFDVNGCRSGSACSRHDHALHGRRPMNCQEDLDWTRQLFARETVGNRIVSSEGFGDHYAGWYDIGTTKFMPSPQGHSCVPIPMTMLVFHDSCVHDWWELHNYNDNGAFGIKEFPDGLGMAGSGQPRLKAAMDALYGCPPSLFPFGKQYGWVNQAARQTYSFIIRLSDAKVQEAIALALPVAKLHKRIGRCEMLRLDMLSDDGLVQGSTFSDGTRIVANLSNRPQEAHGLGLLEPLSWQMV